MVRISPGPGGSLKLLSVLALSSRFDGLLCRPRYFFGYDTFSTRSVESF